MEIPYTANPELLLSQAVTPDFFAHRHAQCETGHQQDQPSTQESESTPALNPCHGRTHGRHGGGEGQQQAQELDPRFSHSRRHGLIAGFFPSRHFPAGPRTLRMLVPGHWPTGNTTELMKGARLRWKRRACDWGTASQRLREPSDWPYFITVEELMRTDPVCGMEVDENKVPQEMRVGHSGRYFYFCSTECRDEFIRNP